jgi:hypothetical protein
VRDFALHRDGAHYRVIITTARGAHHGRLTGDAHLLADAYAAEHDSLSWHILLDRLADCPEEVSGIDPAAVMAGVEWYRSRCLLTLSS